jgi:hypothetical protein
MNNGELPPDYQVCGECCFDHSYEYVEAFNWHQQDGSQRSIPGSKVGWSLTSDELETLNKAKGGLQWIQACSLIRVARGGSLPPDWIGTVIDSGLIAQKIADWTGPSNTYTVLEWSKEADSL